MLIRCSSIFKIIGEPKPKSAPFGLSETARSHVIEIAKSDLFDFDGFQGCKYTDKGNALEDMAIKASGMVRGKVYKKNEVRLENEWISGECDVLDKSSSLIIDEKCSWDIGTHPFFQEEAAKKAQKAGYDYQMQGYMWLNNVDRADVDFWLFPCPEELLGQYGDPERLIHSIERIPLRKRLTTVTYYREEKIIERIKVKVEQCRDFYESLIKEVA